MSAEATVPSHEPSTLSASDDATLALAAAARAAACFPAFANLPGPRRAELLNALATALEAHRAALVDTAHRETALGAPRLNGEIDRTAFQLRAFATLVATGAHHKTLRQEAVAGPPPQGRPALTRTWIPIGPVAVFAPSNFPFAFSVLGGDTAAALAAGNPVIVKGHRGHPDLSRQVARLAREVLRTLGLDEDILQLVQGESHALGGTLVTAPEIAAVGFTGSLGGGRALMQAIATRPVPIPFYGELSSINPILAFPAALSARGASLATTLAASITLGTGQFCTSPGVLVLLDAPASAEFLTMLAAQLQAASTHAMLTAGTRAQFEAGVTRAAADPSATLRAGGCSAGAVPAATLVEVDADAFLSRPHLRDEVFGPYCVAVKVRDTAQMARVVDAIGGSLTATIWADDSETELARPVVARAIALAGRVLFAGVPTGVAVAAAQQHGGPWPSSSRPDTTSVGLAAIDRFLRPITLQDLPEVLDLLPPGVQEAARAGVRSGTEGGAAAVAVNPE